jgi:hypothetical protein
VPRDPYISAVTRHPMAFHPNCSWSWTDYPSPRHPHISGSRPSPVAGRPDVSWSGCHRLHFSANPRWRSGDHYLSSRPRRRYLLCCCRRHRGWFFRTTDQSQ